MSSEPYREVSDEEEEIEDVTEEEKARIRKEVSNMTFEEMMNLKAELGSKLYAKTMYDNKKNPIKRSFKRVNKNRPREMSSKIKPRLVKPPLQTFVKPKQQKMNIDPRFNESCGTFDKDVFKANYKFVDDIRLKERQQLQKQLETTEDSNKQKQIKLLIQRIDNQVKEDQNKEIKQKKDDEEKQQVKKSLKEGKKPLYKSKSARKIEDLISKYEDLKKTNKIQKHIERRSKKLANKERKKLSYVHV